MKMFLRFQDSLPILKEFNTTLHEDFYLILFEMKEKMKFKLKIGVFFKGEKVSEVLIFRKSGSLFFRNF